LLTLCDHRGPVMTLNSDQAPGATPVRECACDCGCRERTPCYTTDMTDEQWAVLEPLLPVVLCVTLLGGRPEKHWRRTMIDAMFYVVDNGCKWRNLPRDFPKWKTVHAMFTRWKRDGVWADIADLLRAGVRVAAGREAEPSAGVIDSQSVHESAEGVVPSATSGFDSWKKVNGRKRHLLVDTLGLLIAVVIGPASGQDRDGAVALLWQARRRGRRRLAVVWTDNGYHGDYRDWSRAELGITVVIVERPAGGKGKGFRVLPRRWVVERTNAWISRRRRCARDYERLPQHHAGMVQIAAIIQMNRRLAQTRTASTAA
jgi:transposase